MCGPDAFIEAFDAQVTLRRPEMTANAHAKWYLGTWTGGNNIRQGCIHLSRGIGGAVVAWSDDLTELGCVRYGPHVSRAQTATESYGSLAKVQSKQRGEITMEFGAYSGWCCPFVDRGSEGRANTMRVVWESQPNHAAGQSVWRRVSGESCVTGGRSLGKPATDELGVSLSFEKGKRGSRALRCRSPGDFSGGDRGAAKVADGE